MSGTWKTYQATISGRDIHPDAPLAQVAVRAFQSTEDFVAPRLFPAVTVEHETDQYYIIDPNSWLLVPRDLRARKNSPNRIEWRVSSDSYAVKHRALAGELAKEDLANADAAIRLRENTVKNVTEGLLRALEDRVALQVTSISNVGSGVTLSGADLWSDYVNSDPVAAVNTGHAFIEGKTGLHANTLVLDKDTYRTVRRHPVLLDMFKYTSGGVVKDEELKQVFEVDNLWVARGIKNMALEGATASIVNIWGNMALLARVDPAAVGLETVTFGLAFRWQPEDFPAPMQAVRYDHPDPGKRVEIVEAGYFQDERIIAKDLSYLIKTTI